MTEQDFPRSFLEIIDQEEKKNPNDIDEAVRCAYRRIKRQPEFEDLIETFIKRAIRSHIHGARHQENLRIRAETNPNRTSNRPGDPKVIEASSVSLQKVAQETLMMRIGNRTLGDLTGFEVRSNIETIKSRIAGDQYNLRILTIIERYVPGDDQRVKNARIPNKAWQEIQDTKRI